MTIEVPEWMMITFLVCYALHWVLEAIEVHAERRLRKVKRDAYKRGHLLDDRGMCPTCEDVTLAFQNANKCSAASPLSCRSDERCELCEYEVVS